MKLNKQALTAFNKMQDFTHYNLLQDTYKNSKTKFKAICDTHGEFSAFLKDFSKPNACHKCKPKLIPHNHINEDEALLRLRKISGFSYGEYNGFDEDMKMFCITHNKTFIKSPKGHLRNNGCSLCSKEHLSNSKKISHKDNINEFIKIHGALYDYSLYKNNGNDNPSIIICKVHGEFQKTPHAHKSGQGCPKCALNIKSLDERKVQFISVHKDRYDYSEMTLDKLYANDIICNNHDKPHKFNQLIINHLQGKGCYKCGILASKAEDEIVQYIESLGITNIIRQDRVILEGKELDIYLPDYKLAIEYNGMVWHSKGTTFPNNIKGFDNKSHINKTDNCLLKEIQLLHIFESEWILNKDKWKSVIRNILNKNEVKIYARQTLFKPISSLKASDFCEENHLQGKNNAKLCYGLYYNNDLVSVMTFKKMPNSDDYELLRFCNKINLSVVGGASKLLTNFKKAHKGTIISYANRRWSQGNLYRTLGFNESHITQEGYFYFHHKDITNLWSRNKFQKHKLVKFLDNFDEGLSANKNIFNNGYRQIFDSGNYVFILN